MRNKILFYYCVSHVFIISLFRQHAHTQT